MNIHKRVATKKKHNTERLSYIGGYFNNYISDILHISVRILGIYVTYLLDNCALI